MGDESAPSHSVRSRRRVLGAAFVLATLGLLACIYCRRPQVESAPRELVLGWRPILSQSGRGTTQTESFQIDTGQWRIKWSAAAQQDAVPGASGFRVGVHSSVSGRLMNVAINQRGAGEGIAYVAEEPRPFFLAIDSSGLEWTVQVEEGVLGERQKNAPYPIQR